MSETTISKRLSSKIPYDITVIGGCIAGLYCAYKLSKYKKVILFDEAHLVRQMGQQSFSSSVKVGFSGRPENPTTGKTPP